MTEKVLRKLLERLSPLPDRLQGLIGFGIFLILCGAVYAAAVLIEVCFELLASQ